MHGLLVWEESLFFGLVISGAYFAYYIRLFFWNRREYKIQIKKVVSKDIVEQATINFYKNYSADRDCSHRLLAEYLSELEAAWEQIHHLHFKYSIYSKDNDLLPEIDNIIDDSIEKAISNSLARETDKRSF